MLKFIHSILLSLSESLVPALNNLLRYVSYVYYLNNSNFWFILWFFFNQNKIQKEGRKGGKCFVLCVLAIWVSG